MSLKFILGASGSGKSRLLFETALRQAGEHPDRNCVVLVPEQFTMQTQRELVMLSPRGGILNIDVLSFTRLAYRVFEQTGVEPKAVLTETGKSLLLRLIAAREASGLSLLSGVMDKPGVLHELKSILSELDQYGIDEKKLSEMIRGAQERPALAKKLSDLRMLQEAYERYQGEKYITGEKLPLVLCRKAPEAALLRGTEFFLDGFTGFTPAQLAVIRTLLPIADRITVTLTIDSSEAAGAFSGKPEDHELFALSKRTIRALSELARETDTPLEKPELLSGKDRRFKNGSELAYLEQRLFRYGRKKVPYSGGGGHQIFFRPCANPAEEALAAALTVVEMVKKNDLHYRDIAVVCGSLPAYSEYVRKAFTEYEIPHFIDRSVSVVLNPAFEFVEASCAVLDCGFSYESVMRLIRTGFIFPKDEYGHEDPADLLDNYLCAAGIRGRKAWSTPFTRETRKRDTALREAAELLRASFMEKFEPYADVMKASSATVREYAAAVWKLLLSCGVFQRLNEMGKEASARGDEARAREYSQVAGVIASVLDEAVGLIGGEKISRKTFEEILQAGFSEARIGIIPPGIDEVHVGDLQRTRLNHIRVVLFLGLNDEYVPARSRKGQILTDLEREYLSSGGVHLAPTAREDANIQQFYLYMMLTKPSSALILSWSAAQRDGTQMREAYLIHVIRSLFPEAACLPSPGEDPYRLVTSRRTGLPVLAAAVSEYLEADEDTAAERGPKLRELLKLYLGSGDRRDGGDDPSRGSEGGGKPADYPGKAAAILASAADAAPDVKLTREIAEKLYGTVLENSVSRLEEFASCPFRHYADYGLRLQEREEFTVSSMDLGNLMHHAIELFSERVRQSLDYTWQTLPDELCDRWAAECVGEAAGLGGKELFRDTERNRALASRCLSVMQRSVKTIRHQVQAGLFTPAGFEIPFDAAGGARGISLDLGDGRRMAFRGRIDRIDLSEDKESKTLYVKIIDYKSNAKKVDFDRFLAGQQLQLIVYMDAAARMEQEANPGKKIVCAGFFYYEFQNPILNLDVPQDEKEIENAVLRQMRVEGLVNEDPEIIRRLDTGLSGDSLVIPVKRNKNGLLAASSSTVTGKQLDLMREASHEEMKDIAVRMLDGEIRPYPSRDNNIAACDWCPYRDVCRFDPKKKGMLYHDLKKYSEDERWERIRRISEGDLREE